MSDFDIKNLNRRMTELLMDYLLRMKIEPSDVHYAIDHLQIKAWDLCEKLPKGSCEGCAMIKSCDGTLWCNELTQKGREIISAAVDSYFEAEGIYD